jgi:hypothetical protein
VVKGRAGVELRAMLCHAQAGQDFALPPRPFLAGPGCAPDNGRMHLLIPFAGAVATASQAARKALVLPNLQRLMQCLEPVTDDEADTANSEWSLSPPHERACAQAFGWRAGDGKLPFAALQAQLDGLAVDARPWGLITPVHWHVGTDQVSLIDPLQLQLDPTSSRTLFDAVKPLFEGDGFVMHHGHATRWYAVHEALADLPCAALDRVIGRNVDAWLGDKTSPQMSRIRRLQAEVQMLLYTHPANDERERQGLLPVNSFWLSGCGVAQPTKANTVQILDGLRQPALADDWAAWAQAWVALDAGPLQVLVQAAAQGQPVQLTLCGERCSRAFVNEPGGPVQRLLRTWRSPAVHTVLERL